MISQKLHILVLLVVLELGHIVDPKQTHTWSITLLLPRLEFQSFARDYSVFLTKDKIKIDVKDKLKESQCNGKKEKWLGRIEKHHLPDPTTLLTSHSYY